MSVSDLISAIENIPKIAELPKVDNLESNLSDAPEWFTKSYLEENLRSHYNDERLKIDDMNLRSALGRGENYGGVLTRMRVDFTTGDGISKTGHYILKTSFEEDEFARKIMEPYDIFNREMTIYENILPKLNELLIEIGDDEQIFAETMAVDYARSALVFEDLNVRGFGMADRLTGLNLDETKIVLRKLAKMHATSAVLNEREQGVLECFDRGMFNRHTDNYAPCFLGMLDACSARVAQWPGYEAYADKLAALAPMYMELNKRVFDATNGHINVLAHGDLWTNNVLIKYDKATGKPLDAIIIDFQYSAWGSPAIDLFYFLNSSLTTDLHFHRQEELIHHYYHYFADTLQKLRYNSRIPSLLNFRLQLEEKSFYAFHVSAVVLPVQRNIDSSDADFNALMQTNERALRFKRTCYKNPYTHQVLKHILPVYERKGMLEPDQ